MGEGSLERCTFRMFLQFDDGASLASSTSALLDTPNDERERKELEKRDLRRASIVGGCSSSLAPTSMRSEHVQIGNCACYWCFRHLPISAYKRPRSAVDLPKSVRRVGLATQLSSKCRSFQPIVGGRWRQQWAAFIGTSHINRVSVRISHAVPCSRKK